MEALLDRLFETLEIHLQKKFPQYIVNVSQIKGSFYILIRKPRGKILKTDLEILFRRVKSISNKVHNKYSRKSSMFRYRYFPYFKLLKCCGNFHYHFLVIRKDHLKWIVKINCSYILP